MAAPGTAAYTEKVAHRARKRAKRADQANMLFAGLGLAGNIGMKMWQQAKTKKNKQELVEGFREYREQMLAEQGMGPYQTAGGAAGGVPGVSHYQVTDPNTGQVSSYPNQEDIPWALRGQGSPPLVSPGAPAGGQYTGPVDVAPPVLGGAAPTAPAQRNYRPETSPRRAGDPLDYEPGDARPLARGVSGGPGPQPFTHGQTGLGDVLARAEAQLDPGMFERPSMALPSNPNWARRFGGAVMAPPYGTAQDPLAGPHPRAGTSPPLTEFPQELRHPSDRRPPDVDPPRSILGDFPAQKRGEVLPEEEKPFTPRFMLHPLAGGGMSIDPKTWQAAQAGGKGARPFAQQTVKAIAGEHPGGRAGANVVKRAVPSAKKRETMDFWSVFDFLTKKYPDNPEVYDWFTKNYPSSEGPTFSETIALENLKVNQSRERRQARTEEETQANEAWTVGFTQSVTNMRDPNHPMYAQDPMEMAAAYGGLLANAPPGANIPHSLTDLIEERGWSSDQRNTAQKTLDTAAREAQTRLELGEARLARLEKGEWASVRDLEGDLAWLAEGQAHLSPDQAALYESLAGKGLNEKMAILRENNGVVQQMRETIRSRHGRDVADFRAKSRLLKNKSLNYGFNYIVLPKHVENALVGYKENTIARHEAAQTGTAVPEANLVGIYDAAKSVYGPTDFGGWAKSVTGMAPNELRPYLASKNVPYEERWAVADQIANALSSLTGG